MDDDFGVAIMGLHCYADSTVTVALYVALAAAAVTQSSFAD